MVSIFKKIRRNLAYDRVERNLKTVGLNFLIGFYYSTLLFGSGVILAGFQSEAPLIEILPVTSFLQICGVLAYVITKFLGFKSIGLASNSTFSEYKAGIFLIFVFSVLSLTFNSVIF